MDYIRYLIDDYDGEDDDEDEDDGCERKAISIQKGQGNVVW